MSSPEVSPAEQPTISNEHVFFINNLRSGLEQKATSNEASRRVECVASGEYGKQHAIEHVSLQAHFEADELLFESTIRLHKEVLAYNWRETLESSLVESEASFQSLDTPKLPHDARAHYLALADNRYARFAMDSEHDGAFITLNTIPREYLQSDKDLPLADNNLDYIVYEYLSLVAAVTNHAVERFDQGSGQLSLTFDIAGARPVARRENLNIIPSIGTIATGFELVALPKPRGEASAIEQTTRAAGFDLLGGLHYPKERLQEIATAFTNPEDARRYGLSQTHFLLHGPPGTGKTSLVVALAEEINAKLSRIPSTEIIDTYVGNSPKYLRAHFDTAFKTPGRQILFFDEFDSIAAENIVSSAAAYGEVQRTLQELITETQQSHPEIIIAAATNADIDDIAPALVRSGRLEPISVTAPNVTERQEIWATLLWESVRTIAGTSEWDKLDVNDIRSCNDPVFSPYSESLDTKRLAELSDGLMGADISQALEKARRIAYRRHLQGDHFSLVEQSDIEQAIAQLFRR